MDLEVDVTDPDAIARLRATPPARGRLPPGGLDRRGRGRGARGRGRARSTPTGPANVAARRRRGGRRAGAAVRRTTSSTGAKGAPYTEDDAAAPLGAYGRTKFAGERAARALCPGTRVARTAWLYGAAGRNFVDTMRRLGAERDEVSVVDDQEGSPTWTRDLGPALEALLDQPPGVVPHRRRRVGHLGGPGRGRLRGGRPRLPGAAASPPPSWGAPPRAPRCRRSRSRVPGAPRLRPWREALADYLEEAA